jgi:hypothetical protein
MSSPAFLLLINAAAMEEDDFERSVLLFLATIISQQETTIRVPPIFPSRIPLLRLLMLMSQQQRRAIPSGANDPHNSPISRMIDFGNDEEFKCMFRLTRSVFESLVRDLSTWINHGRSPNPSQNLAPEIKIGIALYFMAHGGDGVTLGHASGLKKSTALKYLHQVAGLIVTKIAKKWIGEGLFRSYPQYFANLHQRFESCRGVPHVGGCLDGTHVPYKPNSGEREDKYKNYKGWTSILCIALVNSYHCFVDIDVGWPGRMHDKTCTEYCRFWQEARLNPEGWLGKDGIILAESAWGHGCDIVVTPYTANPCTTSAYKQWFNFVHSSTRFFVEETFGRWKNRFRCLLKEMEFTALHCATKIFATAVLHNICTLCQDLDDTYFDQADGSGARMTSTHTACTRLVRVIQA